MLAFNVHCSVGQKRQTRKYSSFDGEPILWYNYVCGLSQAATAAQG